MSEFGVKIKINSERQPWHYRILVLPFYVVRFFYYTLRSRSLRFLRYYPGHYGSTIPSATEIRKNTDRFFGQTPNRRPGIDLREEHQIHLLRALSEYFPDFSFPALPVPEFRYYHANPMYGIDDGLILYAFMRHFRPRRVIEIGSGFSSALMLDTADGHPELQPRFTFIEPFPLRLNRLLRSPDRDRCSIIRENVQDVDPRIFGSLQENDILFIDSSHVVKIGSDLSHILFDVLPALNRGVLVHIHDIWWPFEYPREMVLEGRIWNETYFVHSFLQYNRVFEILYFTSYMEKRQRETVLELIPQDFIGGWGRSLWLKKKE